MPSGALYVPGKKLQKNSVISNSSGHVKTAENLNGVFKGLIA